MLLRVMLLARAGSLRCLRSAADDSECFVPLRTRPSQYLFYANVSVEFQ